jgi:hypothetical protein
MTVKELIAALAACPADMPVYIEGDETGDFPVISLDIGRLRFTVAKEAVTLRAGQSDYDGDGEE